MYNRVNRLVVSTMDIFIVGTCGYPYILVLACSGYEVESLVLSAWCGVKRMMNENIAIEEKNRE